MRNSRRDVSSQTISHDCMLNRYCIVAYILGTPYIVIPEDIDQYKLNESIFGISDHGNNMI